MGMATGLLSHCEVLGGVFQGGIQAARGADQNSRVFANHEHRIVIHR